MSLRKLIWICLSIENDQLEGHENQLMCGTENTLLQIKLPFHRFVTDQLCDLPQAHDKSTTSICFKTLRQVRGPKMD